MGAVLVLFREDYRNGLATVPFIVPIWRDAERAFRPAHSIRLAGLESAESEDGAGRMPLCETKDVCEVSALVGFVEEDDRTRAALVREDELPLQTGL
jgi:hypothetical protein